MKFQELLVNLVTEGTMSKATFAKVFNRWKEENPNITPEEIQIIYNDFDSKKNGWSVETPTPIVYSFLTRFDGKHGYEKFEPSTQKMRNIESFSYKQIMSLLKDYPNNPYDNGEQTQQATIFDTKDTTATSEKIEASKGLWSDPNSALINEGTTRVYKITSEKQSQNFGYYVEKINKSLEVEDKNSPWCVTWRNGSLYSRYRNDGKTFYFVIDDTRNPKDDIYYLGALQYYKNGYGDKKYIITTISNNPNLDVVRSWDEVVEIYPLLKEHKNLIVDKPLDAKAEYDAGNLTFVQQMSETPGPFEFARAPRREKENYLDIEGNFLKLPHSWRSMDSGLRKKYIDTTTRDNYLAKYSTFEFLNEIKKNNAEFNSLNRKLKQFLPDGIGSITDKLLKTNYTVRRASKDNPSFKIYQSRINGTCGIYDSLSFDWVEKDGIKYDVNFVHRPSLDTFYYDENDNSYYVETYENKSQNVKFYAVYENEVGPNAHLISQKKWDELKLMFDEYQGRKPDSETDVDIKETY